MPHQFFSVIPKSLHRAYLESDLRSSLRLRLKTTSCQDPRPQSDLLEFRRTLGACQSSAAAAPRMWERIASTSSGRELGPTVHWNSGAIKHAPRSECIPGHILDQPSILIVNIQATPFAFHHVQSLSDRDNRFSKHTSVGFQLESSILGRSIPWIVGQSLAPCKLFVLKE